MSTEKTRHITNPLTTKQLLDYYLIPELLQGRPYGYAQRVQGKISAHNVVVSKSVIYSRACEVENGRATLHPSAEFHGVPGQREGKDQNYAGFWAMVDMFIPDKSQRRYIGLPSNQIDKIREHVDGYMVVCERDKKLAIYLTQLALYLSKTRGGIMSWPRIMVYHGDIIQFLCYGCEFNIFDLDLMQLLPKEEMLNTWVTSLRTSISRGTVAAINLITTIGRSITEEEYNKRVEYFREALEAQGLRELGYSRFSIRDRQTPMRAERIILKRK